MKENRKSFTEQNGHPYEHMQIKLKNSHSSKNHNKD